MQVPAFEEPSFQFLRQGSWMPEVQAILGDNRLIHQGVFLALPDAENQPYHQDGVHLDTHVHKSPHAVNGAFA